MAVLLGLVGAVVDVEGFTADGAVNAGPRRSLWVLIACLVDRTRPPDFASAAFCHNSYGCLNYSISENGPK